MRRSILVMVAGVLSLGRAPGAGQAHDYSKSLAPYVTSPQDVVEKMLEAAEVKAGDLVYDLGSGDGRVLITAAKKFKAKSVGVEISPKLVQAANERIRAEGLENRCKVIEGDMREVDLSPADVVVLYLLTSSNELLRPNLEKALKRGARVVSHDFEMRGWTPVRIVQAPSGERAKRMHNIYVYEMPPSK